MCESLGEDRVHFALEIVSGILAVVDGLCDRCRQRKDRATINIHVHVNSRNMGI